MFIVVLLAFLYSSLSFAARPEVDNEELDESQEEVLESLRSQAQEEAAHLALLEKNIKTLEAHQPGPVSKHHDQSLQNTPIEQPPAELLERSDDSTSLKEVREAAALKEEVKDVHAKMLRKGQFSEAANKVAKNIGKHLADIERMEKRAHSRESSGMIQYAQALKQLEQLRLKLGDLLAKGEDINIAHIEEKLGKAAVKTPTPASAVVDQASRTSAKTGDDPGTDDDPDTDDYDDDHQAAPNDETQAADNSNFPAKTTASEHNLASSIAKPDSSHESAASQAFQQAKEQAEKEVRELAFAATPSKHGHPNDDKTSPRLELNAFAGEAIGDDGAHAKSSTVSRPKASVGPTSDDSRPTPNSGDTEVNIGDDAANNERSPDGVRGTSPLQAHDDDNDDDDDQRNSDDSKPAPSGEVRRDASSRLAEDDESGIVSASANDSPSASATKPNNHNGGPVFAGSDADKSPPLPETDAPVAEADAKPKSSPATASATGHIPEASVGDPAPEERSTALDADDDDDDTDNDDANAGAPASGPAGSIADRAPPAAGDDNPATIGDNSRPASSREEARHASSPSSGDEITLAGGSAEDDRRANHSPPASTKQPNGRNTDGPSSPEAGAPDVNGAPATDTAMHTSSEGAGNGPSTSEASAPASVDTGDVGAPAKASTDSSPEASVEPTSDGSGPAPEQEFTEVGISDDFARAEPERSLDGVIGASTLPAHDDDDDQRNRDDIKPAPSGEVRRDASSRLAEDDGSGLVSASVNGSPSVSATKPDEHHGGPVSAGIDADKSPPLPETDAPTAEAAAEKKGVPATASTDGRTPQASVGDPAPEERSTAQDADDADADTDDDDNDEDANTGVPASGQAGSIVGWAPAAAGDDNPATIGDNSRPASSIKEVRRDANSPSSGEDLTLAGGLTKDDRSANHGTPASRTEPDGHNADSPSSPEAVALAVNGAPATGPTDDAPSEALSEELKPNTGGPTPAITSRDARDNSARFVVGAVPSKGVAPAVIPKDLPAACQSAKGVDLQSGQTGGLCKVLGDFSILQNEFAKLCSDQEPPKDCAENGWLEKCKAKALHVSGELSEILGHSTEQSGSGQPTGSVLQMTTRGLYADPSKTLAILEEAEFLCEGEELLEETTEGLDHHSNEKRSALQALHAIRHSAADLKCAFGGAETAKHQSPKHSNDWRVAMAEAEEEGVGHRRNVQQLSKSRHVSS